MEEGDHLLIREDKAEGSELVFDAVVVVLGYQLNQLVNVPQL